MPLLKQEDSGMNPPVNFKRMENLSKLVIFHLKKSK